MYWQETLKQTGIKQGLRIQFKIKLTQHKCYTHASVVSVSKNMY